MREEHRMAVLVQSEVPSHPPLPSSHGQAPREAPPDRASMLCCLCRVLSWPPAGSGSGSSRPRCDVGAAESPTAVFFVFDSDAFCIPRKICGVLWQAVVKLSCMLCKEPLPTCSGPTTSLLHLAEGSSQALTTCMQPCPGPQLSLETRRAWGKGLKNHLCPGQW